MGVIGKCGNLFNNRIIATAEEGLVKYVSAALFKL
jgi:hypothetical protein